MKLTGFHRQGILFVVSAPSGTGKSTLCKSLRLSQDLVYSVSCTTRLPRQGEVDGEDYWFLSHEVFKQRIEANDMLEYAQVHQNYYGTPLQSIKEALASEKDVLLDIDIQGADSIRQCQDPIIQNSLVDIFIMPPTFEELASRLRCRGTESEEEIEQRLTHAREEMKHWQKYRYTILSASVKDDYMKFCTIMNGERYLSRRLKLDPSFLFF